MRLRLNPLAQNGLSVVEPTIVNSTTSSSTTTGGTVPTSVDDLSPSQTGNAGKFLKTDGTNATWESIPGGGDMLTTNNLSDLTDAAIARTNLGVDAAGTDNSTNVTLAGTGTYISLTGQQITVDPITESDITDLNHAVDVVSNVATSTILGRVTAGSGNSEELTAAQVRTLINVADGATANSSDATLLARANHTGTQSADTITDGTTNKAYTATEKTKLAGIATGATANTGDVVGPASSVDNELVTFDLATGKLIQGGTTITAAPVVGGGEIKSSGELYLSSIDGTYVNGTNMSTVISDAASAVQPGDLATVATSGSYSDLSSTPTLGTAAAKNIPATGDASATEVVYGTDTRLTDSRTPTSHTHPASELTATGISATTYLRGDNTWATPTDTTYSEISEAEITTGTATTLRTISGRRAGFLKNTDNHVSGTTNKVYTATEQSKLAGIADGATANTGTVTSVAATVPTGMTVSGSPVTTTGTLALGYDTGYQGYTTTEASKLSGIATGATANDTDANLKNTDNHTSGTTNKVYTATEQSKLAGIETGADVTDATNVDAAGATMNSDTTLVGNSYFLDEDNMASDSATKVASQQSIKAYVDAAITATKSALFPVGAIYASTVSTNPGTLLGFGTWAAYGAGRVMVGKAASGTFATGGATGGAETHTLSEAEMPTHTHTQNAHNHTQEQHRHTHHGIAARTLNRTGVVGSFEKNDGAFQTLTDYQTPVINSTTATNQNAGSGSAHNNLQPYIVTYLWERTA